MLGSSVNVNAGGTLKFGFIAFSAGNTTSTFTVGGTAIPDALEGGATYISNQVGGVSKQPINVVPGGNLNISSRATIVSTIGCSGTMTVRGTQQNPNVLLSVTGHTNLNMSIVVSGVLNLAAGSTISVPKPLLSTVV